VERTNRPVNADTRDVPAPDGVSGARDGYRGRWASTAGIHASEKLTQDG